jgi:hypothetical protein
MCSTITSFKTSARRTVAFAPTNFKKDTTHGHQGKVKANDIPSSSLLFSSSTPYSDDCISKYPCNYDIPNLNNYSIQCGGGRDMITHVRFLDQSLLKLTGRGIYERMNIQRNEELLRSSDSNEEKREYIYNSICKNERFVLISHGTEASPVYNFGNMACLNAFSRSWENLTCMPSRECVVSQSQDETLRIELMKNVTDYGFVDGEYRGYRVRGDGKFIKLTECVVWNCYDDKGVYIGQAALFDRDISPIVDYTNE